MRRFFGYLSLVLSLLLGIGVSALPVIKDINANYEYAAGREFTYRIDFKETDDGIDHSDEAITQETSDWVASTMDERLNLAGVSKYQVSQEGTDIIRVTLNRSSDIEYERARILLNYDPNFTVALGDKDKDALAIAGEEVFGTARVEYLNTYPVVVIPLIDEEAQTAFKTLAEAGADNQKAAEEAGTATIPEGQEESQLQTESTIVIWANYDADYDSLALAQTDNEVAGKVFMTFDPRHVYWSQSETEESEIAMAMSLGDADETTGQYTAQNIETANNNANYLKNVFNASSYGDYQVTFLFEDTVAPSVEYLLDTSETLSIAWSKTLIATVVGLILVATVLIVFMRFNGLNAFLLALVTGLTTLATFNLIGMEFTTSGLVGLLVTGLLSLLSVLIYHYKFKEEVYRGRTLKKANSEAAGRSNVVVLDLSIITFLVGIGTYFFGGGALSAFATMLMIGGLVNIVTGLFLPKILGWFLTNETAFQNKYHLFGIDAQKVNQPQMSNDEIYQGRYANAPLTKNHKTTGIGLFVVGMASLTLMLVFGLTSGNVLNPAVGGDYSRVYISLKEDSPISTVSTTTSPEILLGNITIDGAPLSYSTYDTQEVTIREGLGEEARDVDYTYYIFNLEAKYTGEELVTYVDGASVVHVDVPLAEALTTVFEDVDETAEVTLNPVAVTTGTPAFIDVVYATLVSWGLISVYLLLRHGISRALSFATTSMLAALVSVGIFVISRISVLPITALAALPALLFSAYLVVVIINKEKERKAELGKRPDFDYEQEALKSVGISGSLSFLFIALGVLLFLNQFGLAPFANAWLFMALIFAGLLANMVAIKLFVPNELIIRMLLKRLPKIERKKKKKVKTNINQKTSAEPEEAILIGIND